ncbi:E3 ubiquitin-protein ligase MARCH5 [Drosophila sechellia]|uniref:E3 ubiquitin-protein ligase MARCHF5 n=1 Tax=Drosophila sechellia TaxID=7238 RepID=B4IKY3_DROSE|nr:E3 ubiquitin-protein ligase MARCH5 [Drosophila sechellia]EDW52754.1 GM11202 [Drosophila sechellia]
MSRQFMQLPFHSRLSRLRSGLEPPSGNPADDRMCWICLRGDEDHRRRDWVHPCRCRGTNKWVHEACLSRWIDEKEMMSPGVPVTCTQCRTEYIIVMPPLCRFDAMLERLDKCCERMCPSVLMGILAATVYFSAVIYGALTLLELAGNDTGMKLLQEDPSLLMIMLPSVPTLLLLSRLVRWEDCVIRWLRRRNRRTIPAEQLDAVGLPLPGAPLSDEYFDELEREHPVSDGLIGGNLATEQLGRAATSFCIALSLPTISVVLGQKLYGRIYEENKLLSILLGGLTFVAIKGLASIYLSHSQYQQRRQRFVMDYTPLNRINHQSRWR